MEIKIVASHFHDTPLILTPLHEVYFRVPSLRTTPPIDLYPIPITRHLNTALLNNRTQNQRNQPTKRLSRPLTGA